MKAVAEIVAAIILLGSGGYIVPKAVENLKREALIKVQKGLPSLETFTNKLTTK